MADDTGTQPRISEADVKELFWDVPLGCKIPIHPLQLVLTGLGYSKKERAVLILAIEYLKRIKSDPYLSEEHMTWYHRAYCRLIHLRDITAHLVPKEG